MPTKKEEQPKEDKVLTPQSQEKKELVNKTKATFISVAKVLRKPVISEKSANLSKDNNEYVFKVNVKSNKLEIRKSIQELYNVKVESVNTIIRKGKAIRFGKTKGVRSDEKIAIVKVKAGQDINVFK